MSHLFIAFFHLNSLLGGLCTGIWDQLHRIQHPILRGKSESLPHVILKAWADTTNDKYSRGWKHWLEWSETYPEVQSCPADPFQVALYFNDIVLEKRKLGFVKTAQSGIRWGHLIAGYETPTDHPFVKLAFEGAKRLCAKNSTSNQKEPMTADIIKKALEHYGCTDNLLQMRFIVICLLGFSGFMRRSDLRSIQIKHITLFPDHMTILLPHSKTDQHRQGHVLHINQGKYPTCPVAWTQKYIAGTHLTGDDYLISRLAKTKIGHNAIGTNPLSHTALRETFFQMLAPIWDDNLSKSDYSLHSLRSGGATEAAENDVSDRMIGKHGRWAATKSRNTYIKDSKRARLSVTQKLGL